MIRRTLLCYSCLPLFLYLLLASEWLALCVCVQARSVSFCSSDPCTYCCPQTHTATLAQLLFCLNPSFFFFLLAADANIKFGSKNRRDYCYRSRTRECITHNPWKSGERNKPSYAGINNKLQGIFFLSMVENKVIK